ncbi:MAG: TonB-dependent receptor [Verrucomicrobiales bacterium]|nr:TonB-dependent receptor [Verrucomicrobiales bacterium]
MALRSSGRGSDYSLHSAQVCSKKVLKKRRKALCTFRVWLWVVILIISWGSLPISYSANDSALGSAEPDFTSLSLEELGSIKVPTVYGASKHDQRITDAPSSVTIVTSEEVKTFGYRTLADILRGVRGLYVSYDRTYGYIGVRGFNRPGDFGGRTLILVDGHRLNEPLFDSAFNVTDFILDVDLIERVEVIRGPGSTLYGDNAFFGVINVITRHGKDVAGAEISGSVASFDTYQSRVTYGNRLTNGVEVLFSGSYFDSQGHERLYEPAFDTPDQNNGIAEGRDGDTFYSGFASIKYHQFTLEGAYIARDKSAPLAAYETLFNTPQPTIDKRGFARLNFNDTLGEDWVVSASAYYDYYGSDVDYLSDATAPGGPFATVLNKERDHAQWTGFEGQVSKAFDQHRLTLGTELRYDFDLTLHSVNVSPYEVLTDFHGSAERGGLFLQDEYSILTNLVLTAGLRFDDYSSFGNTLNPRAGLVYNPFSKTTFKLLYGQAYRAPNLFEYSGVGIDSKSNPGLGPEHIRTYEMVYEQYLPANLRFSASGFFNQTDNLIAQAVDPDDGLLYYRNVENAQTKGVEMEAEYRSKAGLFARASYTLQRTEDVSTHEELSNSPRQLVKANVGVPLWGEKLGAGLELQYSSRALALPGRPIGSADPYWVFNATLYSREIVKGLELSASVYNLLDEKYTNPAGDELTPSVIRQDGRNFRLKLTYKY